MQPLAIVKEHPVAFGLGAAGLLALFLLRGGSSASAANASPVGSILSYSLQNQQLADAANVQLAQVNGQAGAQASAIAGQMFATGIQTAGGVQEATNQQDIAGILGILQANNSAAATKDNLTYGLAQTQAGQTVALSNINAQVNMNNTDTNAALTAYGQQIGLNTTALADNYALNNKTLDLTSANLPQMLTYSTNLANIQASNSQALAAINANEAQSIASINANSLDNRTYATTAGNVLGGGSNSLLGGILGAFGL